MSHTIARKVSLHKHHFRNTWVFSDRPNTSFVNCDESYVSGRTHDIAEALTHANWLPLLFVYGSSRFHYGSKDCIPFEKYLQSLEKIENAVSEFTFGTILTTKYLHVPQNYRLVIKQFLEFFSFLHSKGITLTNTSLTLDNLMVVGDVIKFWKLDFKNTAEDSKLADIQHDYTILGKFTRKDVLRSRGNMPLPRDMVHLLERLDSYGENKIQTNVNSVKDFDYFPYHLAVQCHNDRMHWILNMHNNEAFIPPKDSNFFNYAATTMSSNTNWCSIFESKSKTPPFEIVLANMSEFAIKKTGNPSMTTDQVAGFYSKRYHARDTKHSNANLGIIKWARDVGTHLPETYKWYQASLMPKSATKKEKEEIDKIFPPVTTKVMELVLFQIFDFQFCDFQHCLHMHGILSFFVSRELSSQE